MNQEDANMPDDLDELSIAPTTATQLISLWTETASQNHRAYSAIHWLTSQYMQPGRAYHNYTHIERMLATWKEMASSVHTVDSQAIALAIWFHDAIYDPKRKDNEERSAEEAVRQLSPLGIGEETLTRIQRMILATATHQTDDDDADTTLLLDLDLAILGAEASEYDAYARAIRTEYDFVPDPDFRSGRTQILQSMLNRPRIYRTELMYARYESQARRNLAREIAALEAAQ